MRVLYVMAGQYGGASAGENRVQKLSRGLGELGVEVRIVGLFGPARRAGEAGWMTDPVGIPYRLLFDPFHGTGEAWRTFFQARGRLRQAVAEELDCGADAAILYGNSWYIQGPIVPLCRERGRPCLIDLNEWYPLRVEWHPLYWDQQLLVRRIFPGVSGLVGITRLWEEHARRRGVPVVRIPPVGEAESPPPAPVGRGPGDPFTLTYVGPLAARDLPATLLEGVRRAAGAGAPIRLVVVGDVAGRPTGREARHRVAADPVLRDRVTFTGWVSDEQLRRRLAEADATVLLRDQNWETRACFPTRLPDYLLTGRPAILSEAGDVPLYFRHRRNAWLVPPGDRPGELAEAIGHLAAHPQEAADIGAAGRRTCLEEFSYRRHAKRLLEFIQALRETR